MRRKEGCNGECCRFVQVYGSKLFDASLLHIPLVGFLPATDPRVIGTIAAIERNLIRDGFVQRYHTTETKDGLPPGEGVFIACSFWLADVYVLQGRYAEARPLQRCRPALRGIRPGGATDAREFPAGLQPCWADQHGAEPGARRGAGGQTRGSGER